MNRLIVLYLLVGNVLAVTPDVQEYPPCVIYDGDKVTGFSIELFEMVAEDAGIEIEGYNKVSEFSSLHSRIRNGEAPISVAGITITGDREEYADFSHPTMRSGLSILVKKGRSINPLLVIINYVKFAKNGLIAIALFIAACSCIIWWLERGHPSFNDNFALGVADGAYWTNTTMTTVGYGDKTPHTALGKAFAIVVMWTGIAIVYPYVIASMGQAMDMTVEASFISSEADLMGKRVATKAGTTSEDYLRNRGISPVATTIDSCYMLLEQDKVDAVVYDMPGLVYKANNSNGKLVVVGEKFDEQYYGFAMPQGSELREPVNRSLAKIQRSSKYKKLYDKWF